MTNNEAIGILAIVVETAKGRCFVTDEAISEAYAMAIKALEAQERQCAAQKRRYTFGNDEFSLEDAYHDCKLVFDGITDDDSFQEADTGAVLYYANEIIYALHEALDKDTNVLSNDCISRQAALDEIDGFLAVDKYYHPYSQEKTIPVEEMRERLKQLPSAQPEIIHCRDCRYSTDFYQDGCCYCKMPSKEMRYIEEGWGFYCAGAERRADEPDK